MDTVRRDDVGRLSIGTTVDIDGTLARFSSEVASVDILRGMAINGYRCHMYGLDIAAMMYAMAAGELARIDCIASAEIPRMDARAALPLTPAQRTIYDATVWTSDHGTVSGCIR